VLYRRSRALGRARSERRFSTRLRFDPGAPELVLSPHRDDAALSCWSLLSDARELRVVNVFAAIPPPGRAGAWEALLGVRDCAERARLRRDEDARALAEAGRWALELPLLEREHRSGPLTLGPGELDRALAAEVQGVSRVYAPAGIGGHVDHVLTRDYARALARTGIPVALYAELPYCVLHGWPAWVRGGERAPDRDVEAYWRSFLASVPELAPLRCGEVALLDPRAVAAKRRAIERYEASLSWSVRRLLVDPELHGVEIRWDLATPDTGSRHGAEARRSRRGDAEDAQVAHPADARRSESARGRLRKAGEIGAGERV
jgi:hypothetical protein